MKRVQIVSIGAAVQDVFLQGKIFKPVKDHGELVNEFELGTKNDIDGVVISTGGGATNASVTFARQGLNSWYMGRIGYDMAGKAVVEDLHNDDVNTSLVIHCEDVGTGYSTILLAPGGERTILTYRGASNSFDLQKKHFKNVKPDWFYVSSLSGDIDSLEQIVNYAKDKKIKIAINPGKGELKQRARFIKLLPHISLLSVNKDEIEMLLGTADLHSLLKKANELIEIVVVTDGPSGSSVIDGKNIYKAGMYKDVPVIDRAGAGDAFCSGFVSQIALGNSIEDAITFGSANSTSVVSKIGAKAGILKAPNHLDKMLIKVSQLT